MKKRVFAVLCLPLFVASQNYRSDLVSVTRKLLELKHCSMQIQTNMYLDSSSAPFDSRIQNISRSGGNIVALQSNGKELLANQRCALSIDKKKKQVTAQFFASNGGSSPVSIDSPDLTRLMGVDYESAKMVVNKPHERNYDVVFGGSSPIRSLSISFDIERQLVNWVKISYRKKTKIRELNGEYHSVCLEIIYKGVNLKPDFAPGYFDEGKYVVVNGNEISLVREYSGYKLNIVDNELK